MLVVEVVLAIVVVLLAQVVLEQEQ